MIQQPLLIASYPRSGSTWIRFLLCRLYYPELALTFDMVNAHIPGIDDPEGVKRGVDRPLYWKTHQLRHASNVMHLHRHVGDVLESEWWYKKKFHDEQRDFRTYLEATDYGKEWRDFVEWYHPALLNLSYDDLGNVDVVSALAPWLSRDKWQDALSACSFERMQQAEQLGFGIYPEGRKDIRFIRSGKSGQWKQWHPELRKAMLEKNAVHLKMLGYGSE